MVLSPSKFGMNVRPSRTTGTTMTVVCDCPSLSEILQSALAGEPLPLCGKPLYDESEDHGEARIMSSDTPFNEIVEQGVNGDFDRNSHNSASEEENGTDVPLDSSQPQKGTENGNNDENTNERSE